MKLRIYAIITISCFAIIASLTGIVSSVSANEVAKPKVETKTEVPPTKPVKDIERTSLTDVSKTSATTTQASKEDKAPSENPEAASSPKSEETSVKKPNGETNLPVPRFVSIKSSEVNTRAGPGNNYPIKWVIIKRDLPVEIVEEFEHWRKIRDISGDEGWVHGAMLSGNRTAIIMDKVWTVTSKPEATSKPVATVEKGVVVNLYKCEANACEVRIDRVDGYLPREALWGLYKGETIKD